MTPARWRGAVAALFAFAVCLHLGTLSNQLTFDDHPAIEANPNTARPFDVIAHVTSGFWGPEYEKRDAAWRPLTTLTFAWNRAVHGVEPLGYHLVNAFVHGLVVVLLTALAIAWGLSPGAALVAAGLFAVHPVHVEAVASAVGRADLLMSAFAIGGLWAWEQRRIRLALALFLFAALAKEMGIAVCAVAMWREGLRLRAATGGSGRNIGYVAAIALVYVAARLAIVGQLGGAAPGFLENPIAHAGAGARIAAAGAVYLHTVGLMIAPITLLADYSYATLAITSSTWSAAIGLVALVATAAAAAVTARRSPALSSSIALWLVPYAVVSHLGPTLPMVFAERTLYLPSAGLCLALGWAADRLSARAAATRVFRLALVVACTLFAARSLARVGDWHDDFTLQLRTAVDAPNNVKALSNAASALVTVGDGRGAVAMAERALEIYDGSAIPHLAAAGVYIELGQPDRAAAHLARAATLDADVARLAATRCALSARFRSAEEALALCAQATEVPYALPRAWMLLAIARDRAGDEAGATAAFAEARRRAGARDIALLFNYGVFLARHRRFSEALPVLEQAAAQAPNRTDVARALSGVRAAVSRPR